MDAFSYGLTALSERDLAVHPPETPTEDLAALEAAFNNPVARLEELDSGILNASEGIAGNTF